MTDTSTRVPPRRPGGLPDGTRVTLDPRVRVHGSVVLGGSPWGVARLAPAALALVARARVDGPDGTVPLTPAERSAADLLVERGVLHPVMTPRPSRVEVVVPAYGRPDLLDACLASLTASAPGGDVLVVDDASPTGEVAAVARAHGARLVQHPENRGPAAARNTGLAATTGDVVAFVDADVTVPRGWLDGLVPLFDDPRVGAVAPRVLPRSRSRTLLARHELARSALDMGARRELVRHGSPLGFLPSATLLVRRSALADASRGRGGSGSGFDEQMRVGEDVDLVWRLLAAGWHVRYEPAVEVHHEMRVVPGQWARRRFEYGTSAAALDDRHPGRLAPARVSAWNLAAAACVLAGRPRSGAAVALAATTALAHRLRSADVDPVLAGYVVGKGLLADGAALGHALRREWWPVGTLVLAAALSRRGSTRSGTGRRTARTAAAAMLVPVALEWVRTRPDVDPARYAALRLVEDAAYGSGVLASAGRQGRLRVLVPEVRLPNLPWDRTRGRRTSGQPPSTSRS